MTDHERLCALVQKHYDRALWECLSRTLRSWRDGTSTLHGTKEMADLVGHELTTPKWMDSLIALLDEVEPPRA